MSINSFAWSLDPLPGLLLLCGAGRHRSVAVSGPSHPPPHTWTKPQLWLEGDSSARMTSVWSKLKPNWACCSPRDTSTKLQTSAPQNTGSFLLSASLRSGWRSFLPEDEEPSTSRWTDCVPLRPVSTNVHSQVSFLFIFFCVSEGDVSLGSMGARCGRALPKIQLDYVAILSSQSQKILWN